MWPKYFSETFSTKYHSLCLHYVFYFFIFCSILSWILVVLLQPLDHTFIFFFLSFSVSASFPLSISVSPTLSFAYIHPLSFSPFNLAYFFSFFPFSLSLPFVLPLTVSPCVSVSFSLSFSLALSLPTFPFILCYLVHHVHAWTYFCWVEKKRGGNNQKRVCLFPGQCLLISSMHKRACGFWKALQIVSVGYVQSWGSHKATFRELNQLSSGNGTNWGH